MIFKSCRRCLVTILLLEGGKVIRKSFAQKRGQWLAFSRSAWSDMQNVSIDFSIFTGGWNLSPLVFLRNCCLMSPLCAFLRHQHPSTRLLLVHIPKFCWFIFPIFFVHIPAEAPFSIADQTLKSTVATVVSCKDFPAWQAACCGHFWKCTGSLAGSDWRVYSTPRKNTTT